MYAFVQDTRFIVGLSLYREVVRYFVYRRRDFWQLCWFDKVTAKLQAINKGLRATGDLHKPNCKLPFVNKDV